MNKIFEGLYKFVCTFLIVVAIFSITTIKIEKEYNNNKITYSNSSKIVSSKYILSDKLIYKEPSGNTTRTKPTNIDTTNFSVISTEYVNVSHFGPDCNGCGVGMVASGDYIGHGRINYKDKTFGVVRIVAADNKYPLGTIIRLTHGNNIILAIVLDRGGGIGDHKKYQIDLLAESEAQSSKLGVMNNTKLEVLRIGH